MSYLKRSDSLSVLKRLSAAAAAAPWDPVILLSLVTEVVAAASGCILP